MAEIINMPRLSDTMTEGVVATWLKKVGDKIQTGDILAEIETDKATMEFESFYDGTLLYIGIQEGETAPVDSLLAIIGKEGEDISKIIGGESTSANAAPVETSKQDAPTPETASIQVTKKEMPSGVSVVTMPRLSDTMTEGTVATWLKKVGDAVQTGEILAEIETDKATMEFESFYDGTLLHIGVNEGQTASVDAVLAIIGPAGTDVNTVLQAHASGETLSTATDSVEEPKAEEKQIETIISTEISSQVGRIFASPLAKKMAEEKGIDLSKVKGSGENGRIVKADVENYKPEAILQTVAPVETIQKEHKSSFVNDTVVAHTEEIKNSQMRKTIAKRLAESKFTAPHYYLKIEVSMDEAMKSRAQINQLPDTKISFNDMVIKATAMALRKHPKVNSQWRDDATLLHHHVNIGVAVAVEDGLVVPVINHTDTLHLSAIGNAVKDLAGKARNKKLQPQEMEGSTFTISNLGMFGITEFTSIINQPNSAILSVGAIIEKPVVKNGQIVVGNTMMLTLACDHRTVDGATGAQFLQTLKTYLETPVTMLA